MKMPGVSHCLGRNLIGVALALLAPALFCTPAQAQATATGLCNTGWDAGCSGKLATTGAVSDDNYVLFTDPVGSGPVAAIVVNMLTYPISPAGPWLADVPFPSHWIGPAADQAFGNGCCIASLNPYVYRDAFAFGGAGTTTVTGRWASDNEASIYLDGVGIPMAFISDNGLTAFAQWHPFSLTLPASGNHFLEFRVVNFSNATGLRVEYDALLVPEPATWRLAALGACLLAFVIKRHSGQQKRRPGWRAGAR